MKTKNKPFISDSDIYVFTFLVVLGSVLMLLCDVFAYKLITIFDFEMTTSGAIFPFALLISDLISERWGVKKALFFMFTIIIVAVAANAGLWILASIPGPNYLAYNSIFHLNWRVIFSSVAGIFIAFSFNVYAINLFQKSIYTASRIGIYFRDTSCNIASKALLITVSYTITFTGILSFHEILLLVIATFIFKILVGFFINMSIPFILDLMNSTIRAK